MTERTTATVETLTAEVRVLMVGNRQVTLSVYRQLDAAHPRAVHAGLFVPMGRVRAHNPDQDRRNFIAFRVQFVGRSTVDGSLMRMDVSSDNWYKLTAEERASLSEYMDMPLIVLAGLR